MTDPVLPTPAAASWLTPRPLPPGGGLSHVVYGLTQPLLALRVVIREPGLRRTAAVPVLVFTGFCVLVAMGSAQELSGRVDAFITALITLASAPVILFGKTYRRLAAAARVPLGLSPRTVDSPTLRSAVADAIRQAILIGLGLVPIYFAFQLIEEFWPDAASAFATVAWILGGFWALHWIVIEALDNGHTGPPPDAAPAPTIPPAELPDPWFVRLYQRPLTRFAGLLRRLSRPWRRELELVARHPALAFGFGLGIAALIAVPFVALVFRPAAVVAAVHLLGRTDAGA